MIILLKITYQDKSVNKRREQFINFGCGGDVPTKEEQLRAYAKFFKIFGVNIKNQDGKYKSLEGILLEAHNNLFGEKDMGIIDLKNEVKELKNKFKKIILKEVKTHHKND